MKCSLTWTYSVDSTPGPLAHVTFGETKADSANVSKGQEIRKVRKALQPKFYLFFYLKTL